MLTVLFLLEKCFTLAKYPRIRHFSLVAWMGDEEMDLTYEHPTSPELLNSIESYYL